MKTPRGDLGLREQKNSRTTVCAKTMVANRMPNMNKIWKVGVMSVDVVARTRSGIFVSLFSKTSRIRNDVQVATIAANSKAESTQSKHCEEPACAATCRVRPRLDRFHARCWRVSAFCCTYTASEGSLRSGWSSAATARELKRAD